MNQMPPQARRGGRGGHRAPCGLGARRPGGTGRGGGGAALGEQEVATLLSRCHPRDKNTSLQNRLRILLLRRTQPLNSYSVLSLDEQLFLGTKDTQPAGSGPEGAQGGRHF
jgi:hypothetical protein